MVSICSFANIRNAFIGMFAKWLLTTTTLTTLPRKFSSRFTSHIDKFREDAQLFTWIYRIATNECLSFLQRKKRRFFLPIGDVEGELTTKLDSTPGLSGDEIQLKLQKALLKLPDKQRLVFNMKYFDDMPYEQISEITDTSVGALKASYHHAVKKIEDFLSE